jgi:hypothetical protein
LRQIVEPQQKRRIVDHGDLGLAGAPPRRDVAQGGVGIDRVSGDPAPVLEVEREPALLAGRGGVAAGQVFLLLAVVLRLVRRDRILVEGGACGLAVCQLGMALERREAFRQVIAFAQDGAEVLVRERHVGLQRDRAPVARRRLIGPALQPEDIAEIAMRQDVTGLEREQSTKRRRGFLQAALILEDEAEIVGDAGVIGAGLQNAAVELLRLGQSSGAMVDKRLLQRGVERRGLRDHSHRNSEVMEIAKAP